MQRPLLLFVAMMLSVALQAQYLAENRATPKPADAYAQGEQAYRRGDHEEAVRLFTEAIKADPGHLNAFLQRAFCLNILKRYEEAITDLTVVIGREPAHALAYTTRGSSYLKAGRPDLALADLEKVISLEPRNEEAWNNIGWAHKSTGDMAAACKAWRTSQRMGNGEAKIILNNNRCK